METVNIIKNITNIEICINGRLCLPISTRISKVGELWNSMDNKNSITAPPWTITAWQITEMN